MLANLWFLYFLVGISSAEKIRNYYQGVEDPGIGKSLTSAAPKEQYFSQRLNHFDPTDQTTWLQVS